MSVLGYLASLAQRSTNACMQVAAPQTSDELFVFVGQGCLYIKLSCDEEIQKDEVTSLELVQELDADLNHQCSRCDAWYAIVGENRPV